MGIIWRFFTEFGQASRIVDNNYPKFRYSLIVNCDERKVESRPFSSHFLERGKGEKKESQYDENALFIWDFCILSIPVDNLLKD
jgi:hypothetical protein